ncbi:MAG: oligosaccharide flippase family protein, partial [Lachnospiraceae bacterium]|nr:oligosaccharide flippase family protein [Lachnospiraceae bacterium]
MSERSKKVGRGIVVQGGILAAAGLIARAIGIVRRIPLTNIIGDMGNGYYAAAYELYAIILLLSSYSLPLAVSKMVSARVSRGQYKNAAKIFKASLMFAVLSGGIACLFVLIFADFLAGVVMGEIMSATALRVLAPTLLIVAIMGVFRGYFQGLGTMTPTAISQIVEQIFLVIFSLVFA